MAFASTVLVGPDKTYPSPNALYQANILQDGDTILIDAFEYSGQDALAVWSANDILIQGVGGRPHLIADGAYIQGKGIWVIKGNNCTVENIEFSDAKVPDLNGAGIRLDGVGLTLRHCYFHENENGLLTSNPYAGDILIEYCEFENGGFGNGFSHNLYIGHVNSLTFQFNYSHHGKVGHLLKSRAQNNIIRYNRIMDEETGYSSRLIDLPNGGFALIIGNLLMQGMESENSNMLGYGPEGLSNDAPHELYVINNTFVNDRVNTGIFISIKNGTDVAQIQNNIFVGDGTVLNGDATLMTNNFEDSELSNLNFEDALSYNYKLTETSPVIDLGTNIPDINDLTGTPEYHYIHPNDKEERALINSNIDIGAYEYGMVSNIKDMNPLSFTFYPNPAHKILYLQGPLTKVHKIMIRDISGQTIWEKFPSHELSLSGLKNGIHVLCFKMKTGNYISYPIVISSE